MAALALAGVDELRATITAAEAVVPVGGRTHWEVGGPPPRGVQVRAPAGVLAYDPAELTVTVGSPTRARSAPSTPATRGAPRSAARSPPASRGTAASATGRYATVCSRCASSPPTGAS
jgi:hypothetical protein